MLKNVLHEWYLLITQHYICYTHTLVSTWGDNVRWKRAWQRTEPPSTTAWLQSAHVGSGWLYGLSWLSFALFCPDSHWLALFSPIWPSLTPVGPVWTCLALFGSVWPYFAPFSFATNMHKFKTCPIQEIQDEPPITDHKCPTMSIFSTLLL